VLLYIRYGGTDIDTQYRQFASEKPLAGIRELPDIHKK
jgi:hypothetical protein